MTLFLTAFSLGLLGSLHCIAMCGPIAMALPLSNGTKANRVAAALLYNTGRAITYLLIGFLIGVLGKAFSLIGVQQIVSISLGSIILLSYIIPDVFSKTKFIVHYNRWFSSLKAGIKFLFKKKSVSSMFAVGLLNGLLPCGLVYMAIAAALALETVMGSALFMMFFGLGTFPLMLSLVLVKNKVSTRSRFKLNKALPTIMMIMAVFLIFRGLNLGIPYLSPEMNKQNTLSCHEDVNDKKIIHSCTILDSTLLKK